MAEETPPPDQPPAAVTRTCPPQAVQTVGTVTQAHLALGRMADRIFLAAPKLTLACFLFERRDAMMRYSWRRLAGAHRSSPFLRSTNGEDRKRLDITNHMGYMPQPSAQC